MKRILNIILLMCSTILATAQSKKFQELGGNYEPGQKVQGLKSKGILIVPSFSSLPTYPITYGTDSTRGAIAYVVGDSSLNYWTGHGWISLGTGSGADTTNLSNRIDSIASKLIDFAKSLGTRWDGTPIITWSGEGLTYNFYGPKYWINGVQYPSVSGSFTLDPAPVTQSRIDVITADTMNAVNIRKGDSAVSPIRLIPDGNKEIELGSIYLNPGDTVPHNLHINWVYREGVEWDTTSNMNPGNTKFRDTSNPHGGSYSIKHYCYTGGNFSFKSATPVSMDTITTLSMWIKLPTGFPGAIELQPFYEGVRRGKTGRIPDILHSRYGAKVDFNGWQKITIPITSAVFGPIVDSLVFIVNSSDCSGWQLDDISFQGPVATIETPDPKYVAATTDEGSVEAKNNADKLHFRGAGGFKFKIVNDTIVGDASGISGGGGSGGGGGISKIVAGYGQVQVNDSTTNNDTTKLVSHERLGNTVADLFIDAYKLPGVDSFYFVTKAGNILALKDSVGLGTTGNTADLDPILDSTLNSNQRVLFALGNKILGSAGLLFDSTNKALKVGFTVTPPASTTHRFMVGGNSYFGGNLGIGTLTASALIHAYGSGATPLILERSTTASNVAIQYKNQTASMYAGLSATSDFAINSSASLSASPQFVVKRTSGNVGLGTNTPASLFAASGNASIGSGYAGTAAPVNGLIIEGQLGIGTSSPHSSSILDMGAVNNKALRIPMGTTSQMNSIPSPATWSLYWNTDSAATGSGLCTYNGSAWVKAFRTSPDMVGVTRVSPLDSMTKVTRGIQVSGGNLVPQSADITNAGFVNTSRQNFAGVKNFRSPIELLDSTQGVKMYLWKRSAAGDNSGFGITGGGGSGKTFHNFVSNVGSGIPTFLWYHGGYQQTSSPNGLLMKLDCANN
jgi:hypothetical protein